MTSNDSWRDLIRDILEERFVPWLDSHEEITDADLDLFLDLLADELADA